MVRVSASFELARVRVIPRESTVITFRLVYLRNLSEISRRVGGGGGGRWETGEGRRFLSPSKGRVMKKKMSGKEGGSQKNKPPRS